VQQETMHVIMQQFTKAINGIEFNIQGIMEGKEEVCRVSVDNQSFKMIIAEDGSWEIPHQVPMWIKKMEKELSAAIDEAYC
jgi:hypothetical protein